MSLSHGRIVLIETHAPGNLGAAARVMRNFGLSDLVLVAPIADRCDQNARQMATHGAAILDNARIVADLNDAIGDCVLVIGTSAKCGGLFRGQNVGTPREVMPRVVEVLQQDRPAALVFGPEPTGLSNAVITRCHHLIQIPTADEYPALNLAQAVAICLYELHVATSGLAATRSGARTPAADHASLESQELMFAQLQTALEEIHFLYGDKAGPLMHAVRHLLGKARLTDMEVKVLLGMARQIRWHVANHPDRIGEN
ncbi:MAG: RNA methyltransferase [Planctomycetes bacterium]|nr:RNA methyltransferase [Planctomycetota bacterium]